MNRPQLSLSPYLLALLCALPGCATAADNVADAAVNPPVDATVLVDAPDLMIIDAARVTIDAPLMVDAATPMPDACMTDWIDLLQNGGFDMQSDPWSGTTGVIRESNSPWSPQAGSAWALFSGSHNANHELSQTVTIPASTSALRLRGYRCWVTQEINGMYDFLTIELRDQSGNVIETLWERDNSHAGTTCSWSLFQLDPVDSHAGKDIDLVFLATSDNASLTSFGFDTLTFEAMACL